MSPLAKVCGIKPVYPYYGVLIFSFRKIISYVSTFTALVPGDVIVCGTPVGAGARFDPPKWLKPGDKIEVEAEGIGILSNYVADEVIL